MMRVLYFMLRALYTHMGYTHNQTRCITLELSILYFFVLSNNPPFLQINSQLLPIHALHNCGLFRVYLLALQVNNSRD